MRFASLIDQPMDEFTVHATLVQDSLQRLFDRRLYCDLVNYKSHPRNLIFFLRPAKKIELNHLAFSSRYGEEVERSAINALGEIIQESFPRPIANFRFVRDGQNPSQVYMVNDHGQRSSSRNIDFFLPRSKTTLLIRCDNLGNYCWHGTTAMIKPFMEFCLSTSDNTGENTPGDIMWTRSGD